MCRDSTTAIKPPANEITTIGSLFCKLESYKKIQSYTIVKNEVYEAIANIFSNLKLFKF